MRWAGHKLFHAGKCCGRCCRIEMISVLMESTMTFPVTVHPSDGRFEAALIGAPNVSAVASSREEALSALESAIAKQLDQGELVMLEVRPSGLADLFGKYRDDP